MIITKDNIDKVIVGDVYEAYDGSVVVVEAGDRSASDAIDRDDIAMFMRPEDGPCAESPYVPLPDLSTQLENLRLPWRLLRRQRSCPTISEGESR